jgi:uncharacterized protein (UPF0305 family)
VQQNNISKRMRYQKPLYAGANTMKPLQPPPLMKRTTRSNSNDKTNDFELKHETEEDKESKSLLEKSNESSNSVSSFQENNTIVAGVSTNLKTVILNYVTFIYKY